MSLPGFSAGHYHFILPETYLFFTSVHPDVELPHQGKRRRSQHRRVRAAGAAALRLEHPPSVSRRDSDPLCVLTRQSTRFL